MRKRLVLARRHLNFRRDRLGSVCNRWREATTFLNFPARRSTDGPRTSRLEAIYCPLMTSYLNDESHL